MVSKISLFWISPWSSFQRGSSFILPSSRKPPKGKTYSSSSPRMTTSTTKILPHLSISTTQAYPFNPLTLAPKLDPAHPKPSKRTYSPIHLFTQSSQQTTVLLLLPSPNVYLPTPPVIISTYPTHVDYHQLRELYIACNHSCHKVSDIDSSHALSWTYRQWWARGCTVT